MLKVNHKELVSLIKRAYEVKQSLFVQGGTGIGKSQSIEEAGNQLARQLGLKGIKIWPEFDIEYFNIFDIRLAQMDPVDVRGLPFKVDRDGQEMMSWLKPDFFAVPPETKGIYLFDELNLAPPLIQASAYSFINDRRCGNATLPEGCGVVAAGNRMEDKAAIFEMAKPLANRLLHCELTVPDKEAWNEWGIEHGIDARIVNFLYQNPSYLYRQEDIADPDIKAFCTPRSWAFCSKMITGVKNLNDAKVYASTAVGEAAAAQFEAFIKLCAEVDIDAIMANPQEAAMPTSIDMKYALVSALSEHFRAFPDKDVLKSLLIVAGRIPADFGILIIRLIAPFLPTKLRSQFTKIIGEVGLAENLKKYFMQYSG